MRRNLSLTDLVRGSDPSVNLWGSLRGPALGSPEDRRREAQYDREFRAFMRMSVNFAAFNRAYARATTPHTSERVV